MINSPSIYWMIVKDYHHSEDHTREVWDVIDDFTIYPAKTEAEEKLKEIYNHFFNKIGSYDNEKHEIIVKYYKTTVRYHITSVHTQI